MNHPVHTNLEPLLLELPDFCLQSKAVNTRRSYESAFNKWCKWCVPYNIYTLPASDMLSFKDVFKGKTLKVVYR
jgi:hypothetical protein